MMFPSSSLNKMKQDLQEIRELKEKNLDPEEFARFQTLTNSFFKKIFFLVSDISIFYSCLFLKVSRRFDYNYEAPAGVHLENGDPVLTVNPLFLINNSIGEIQAIIVHELYHILLLHLGRALETADHDVRMLENIAMDYVVNRSLTKDITALRNFEHVKLPPDTINTNTLCRMFPDLENEIRGWEYDNGSYEKYFKILLDRRCQDTLKQQREAGMQKFLDDLQEDLNNVKDGKMSPSEFADKYKKVCIIPKHSSWENSKNVDGNSSTTFKVSKEMINEDLKRLVNQLFQEVKNKRGTMPHGFEELIEKINGKHIISWQQELTKLVGSVRVPFEKTTRRRSRRLPERLDIPGRRSKKIVKLAVAIDTSGSMSKKELEKSFNEIFNILKATAFELTVIECDAAVQRVYTAHNKNDIKLNVKGRGGTSFIPVFEYIKNIKLIEKQPDLLIYFTDGGGDYDFPSNLIPRKTVTMWVLTESIRDLSLKTPFGILKELHLDSNDY